MFAADLLLDEQAVIWFAGHNRRPARPTRHYIGIAGQRQTFDAGIPMAGFTFSLKDRADLHKGDWPIIGRLSRLSCRGSGGFRANRGGRGHQRWRWERHLCFDDLAHLGRIQAHKF